MCGCGKRKATTSTVYALTVDGELVGEYASKPDAEYEKTVRGGGTITPVRK